MFKKPVLQFMAFIKKKRKKQKKTKLQLLSKVENCKKPLRLMHHKGICLANIYVAN